MTWYEQNTIAVNMNAARKYISDAKQWLQATIERNAIGLEPYPCPSVTFCDATAGGPVAREPETPALTIDNALVVVENIQKEYILPYDEVEFRKYVLTKI